MRKGERVLIDTPSVIVDRGWFDEAITILSGRAGCPFCGSKREPYIANNGGVERAGCLDCNRFFTEPR
jgi:transposase-like protein